ncbi:hypothetical protein LWI29_006340 [Acer saccharum]|uniref:Magnesium transporter n=1 Tax=Acer saccharum TaxID=4024 RepID=A0AA39SU94_ACESA|nr:hypothetical protein LWI29_006340 [Acer saccharum]
MEFHHLTKKGKKNHEEIRTFQISSNSTINGADGGSIRGIAPSKMESLHLYRIVAPLSKANMCSSTTCTPPITSLEDELRFCVFNFNLPNCHIIYIQIDPSTSVNQTSGFLLWSIFCSLMADLKERLLPIKPASALSLREASYRPSASGRQPFHGVDVWGLKKRGQGLRSWIRVDASGNSQIIEVDKFTMMRRCDLPARDLRLLDPLFVYPSTILGREKAIVVNLEQIRCIITADEVLLLNSLDSYVLQYVVELQRRLTGVNEVWQSDDGDPNRRRSRNFDNVYGNTCPDYLPFEFRALEVALEAACTFLDSQAAELEIEAYPLLDELTSKISTLNLERVRRLKSRLVALTRRVQKVRDEIEQLMDDDGDMAECILLRKKGEWMSPVSSPPDSRRLEKSLSIARSRHESMRSSDSATESVEELEMLLEAYFVVIDSTLNKLTSLKEYIDDTEDFINIQLDNVRNQLIQFELLLTTATFVVAIFGVVAGIFGMNFTIPLFDDEGAFKWVLIITGITGFTIFSAFVWFFKYRRLMPL